MSIQRGVMLEIIEKQGVLLRFSVPTRHVKRERVIYLSLASDSVFQINSKTSHFMILSIIHSGHVYCPIFENWTFRFVPKGMRYLG